MEDSLRFSAAEVYQRHLEKGSTMDKLVLSRDAARPGRAYSLRL
jgi:hypothetical protein